MGLPSGTNLGAYTVLAPLGAGAMGEVYRARDTRLGRDVAVKVLPRAFSSDPDRLARFLGEAKILASLNHPNIGAIYGFEELPDGERFLVLELVEGETLADRLARGALPPPEAILLCAGIAEALEAAHDRGVIHRDLKPGNVMLPKRGGVKVLDFGIARRTEPTLSPSSSPSAAAVDSTVTRPSAAYVGDGTPEYMSPEQARGDTQGPASDIFAFGCVLYECLTARRAFPGATVIDVIAAILAVAPRWSALPPDLPASVRGILESCLEKDPSGRPRSIGEVRAVLGREPLSLGFASETDSATPHNLPLPLTSFVERAGELSECERLLGRMRLLTLTGVGGSGKTRLGIRLAQVERDRHPDGVWFADLALIQDPERVPQSVADALGVQEEPGKPIVESLVKRLSGQRVLLVMDNCEHLLPACASLAKRLLASAPSLRMLATSREALGVPGEQIYPVPPLSLPADAPGSAGELLASSEAMRLFEERARQADPGFVLGDDRAETVAEICRRLDGIPLAIELAAARVAVLSVEQIRAMLKDVFRLLAGGESDLPRHQTLHAAIHWSYEQLPPEEKRLFRALSVFAGGTTLEGALAVLGSDADEFELLDLLTRLVDKSLVVVRRPEGREPRYQMLETVRQYARIGLEASGEGAAARDRHLRFHLAFVDDAAPRLLSAQQGLWLARLDAERENVLAAHAWCDRAEGGGEMGLRLAGGTRLYWLNRGFFQLGLQVTREALGRAGADRKIPPRALALYAAGSLAYSQGYYDEANAFLEESASICRSLGDRGGEARALYMLGTVETSLGRLAKARATLQEVISIAREIGDKLRLSVGLGSLAEVVRVEGDLPLAAQLYEEALGLARDSGNVDTAAVFLLNLAAVEIHRGRLVEARLKAAGALRVIEEIGSKRLGQAILDLCSGLAAAEGDDIRAARIHGASEVLLDRMGAHREPVDERFLEPLMAKAQEKAGASAFLAAEAMGRKQSFEEALAETRGWLAAG